MELLGTLKLHRNEIKELYREKGIWSVIGGLLFILFLIFICLPLSVVLQPFSWVVNNKKDKVRFFSFV